MIYLTLWVVTLLLAVSTSHGKRVLKVDSGDIGAIENEIEDDGHRQLASEALPKAEEHRVTNLPGLTKDDVVTQFAGHLPADPAHGGNFFYWLFESKKDADKKPLIIWLNGGPGCSSMDGLWLELGPFRIVDGGRTVKWNKYSWHEAGNLLFVDQPVGTGLSFTNGKEGLAKNDKMVNEHFYTFLTNFLSVHDRYVVSPTKNGAGGGIGGSTTRRRSRPIIFTGESHAGHYIPSLARYILEQNQQPENALEIVVQGIALGNPWIDPVNQYNPAEFAHGLGIINRGQVNRLKEQERQCRQLLQDGKLNNKVCMNLLDDVIEASSVHNGAKVIMYDTRQYAQNANAFPPGHDAVETYLNRADVRRAIHATRTPQRYVECADPPYFALSHQDGKGVTDELSYLLDRGLPVLIYLGQYDLICNHMNMEKVLDGLWWTGRNDWLTAQPGVWMQGNRPVGYIRRHKNLQSLLVMNAGHMVPMDLPDVSLAMLQTFVNGGDFASGVSKIGVTVSPSSLCTISATEATTATAASAAASVTATAGAKGHRGRRQLLDGVRASNHLQFYPVLIHATPLETEVFLRIRMQPLTNSGSGGGGYHHSASSIASAHKMQQAWDALASSSFYLLVEPTDQVIRFSENRTWYTAMNSHRYQAHHPLHNGSTPANGTHRGSSGGSGSSGGGLHANPPQQQQQQQQQHHLDIVVAGLQYGVVYTFSLHHEYDTAALPSHLPASFARSIHTKVGCFAAGFEQCCGRGDCVLATPQSPTPHCHCDAGYSGEHCDHYAIVGVSPTVSHRRQLQFANVSATDSMCPRRVTPAATAFHVALRQLPHRTASTSTSTSPVVADVTAPSATTSTVANGKPSAVRCGAGDSDGNGGGEEETDASPCCTAASMRVLHKSIAADSNVHAHTNEYRVVQRQRLQSGLTQLLRSLPSPSSSVGGGGGGAAIRVQVTELGSNEGGRRGQSLSVNVCGPPAVVTAALKQFSSMVDSDTVDVKGAHDLYAIQGPVVVKAAARTAAYQPASAAVAVKAPTTPTTGAPHTDGALKSSTLRKETTTTRPPAVDPAKTSAAAGATTDAASVAVTASSASWSFSSVANIALAIVAVISLSLGLARCYPRQPSASLRLYNR